MHVCKREIVWVCAHVEIKGQLVGTGSFLLPCRFLGRTSAVLVASLFICWAFSLPLYWPGILNSLPITQYVAQAGLEFTASLLSQPLKCWEFKCKPPHLIPKIQSVPAAFPFDALPEWSALVSLFSHEFLSRANTSSVESQPGFPNPAVCPSFSLLL